VGRIAETKEELAKMQAEEPGASGEAAAAAALVPSAAEKKAAGEAPPAGKPKKVKISPKARKMAGVHGIDYTRLQGSGPGGRIVAADIEKAIAAGGAASTQAAAEVFTGEVVDGKRVKQSIPLAGMRQVIAEHMVKSLQVSAQLTAGAEVDMTEMVRLRQALKRKPEFKDGRLSFTDIFVYIIAKVLKAQPLMNASLIGGDIKLWEDVNIGVAAALQISEHESGLVVPVLKNAERMSLFDISRGVADLVTKAREGKLGVDDMVGGTFTLTNTGVFGKRWTWATPVLNQPQVGILQTGAIVDRVVAVEGEMVIKPMMPLILTFDHRVIDGAAAAKFVFQIVELMEDPYQLIG
jgi:pyruvate/2-oxoglutarate dehydrogenase complex dihydrolipoamide acyltransferase (E2) component